MRRLLPATILYVAHMCVCLTFGVSAVSLAAQPTSRPIRQSTTAITGGQSNDQRSTGASVRYPTMLDMTFPEFEASVKKTDIVLVPIGAIEEHSSHLPLGTDAMNATAQTVQVQEYLGALESFACHAGASTEWWTRGDWRVRQNQVRSVRRCCRSRGVCPLTVSHGGVQ
jgi:hypothetical protein